MLWGALSITEPGVSEEEESEARTGHGGQAAQTRSPFTHLHGIVGKKWEPGNLVPSRFLGQIRKVEARLGKLAKIRKVETN